MRLLFTFYILHLTFHIAYSQSAINGKAKGYEGQPIMLYKHVDFVTFREELLASDTVNEDGSFQFNINIPRTVLGIFKTPSTISELYIEPKTDYQITYHQKDSSATRQQVKKVYVQTELANRNPHELNFLIERFNEKYDAFVRENYAQFITKKAKQKVDTFETKMAAQFGQIGSEYFRNYVEYSIAMLKMIARESRKKLHEQYIDNRSVLYHNDAYMDFINKFYNQYFSTISFKLQDELLEAIKTQKNWKMALDVLGKDDLMRNERIRELVLLIGLYETYYLPEYDKKTNLYLIKTIGKETVSPNHRAIAENMVKNLTRLAVGSKAPDFELLDKNGQLVKLADFKGKYVYIDFWATWCAPCLTEMKMMPGLKNKYEKQVEFVGISIDKDEKSMKKFLEKKPKYDWNFLHYGHQPEIKDIYNIRGIPMYYLIDPDGLIIQSPAFRPSGRITEIFEKIQKESKKGKPSFLWEE